MDKREGEIERRSRREEKVRKEVAKSRKESRMVKQEGEA